MSKLIFALILFGCSFGTPLTTAARAGNYIEVRRLIEDRADPNQTDEKGDHPLYCAAERGNPVIVKYLLDNQADINESNFSGSSALNVATAKQHFEVVKLLVWGNADVDQEDCVGWTPLVYALGISGEDVDLEIADFLIENGADMNHINRMIISGSTPLSGETYLTFAVSERNVRVIDFLLQKNVDCRH